jgi:hypothetical protein
MRTDFQRIVNNIWSFAHGLRNDGPVVHGLRGANQDPALPQDGRERTKPPYNQPVIVPAKHGWDCVLK